MWPFSFDCSALSVPHPPFHELRVWAECTVVVQLYFSSLPPPSHTAVPMAICVKAEAKGAGRFETVPLFFFHRSGSPGYRIVHMMGRAESENVGEKI